jgi:hypothetical protein
MTVRVAGAADVDAVVATITTAFFHDPLWGPAFPDVDRRAGQASAFWRFLVTASLRHGWTMVTPAVEAAAVWIPPGGEELTADEEAALERLLVDTAGRAVTDDILKIFEVFEATHPHEPHFYLSLLGTHGTERSHDDDDVAPRPLILPRSPTSARFPGNWAPAGGDQRRASSTPVSWRPRKTGSRRDATS